MVTGIIHAAYNAKDMEASVNFYCDKLGFTRHVDINHKDGSPWIVYLRVPSAIPQYLELFYGKEERPASTLSPWTTVGYNHLCLSVDDIEETCATLKSKGVVLDSEPTLGDDGNYQAWVHDPDGNRIELMQMMPNSMQYSREKNLP
jgi:catechol 2,3-dioxygenase-like lactoylglutathione lyase family enzyme